MMTKSSLRPEWRVGDFERSTFFSSFTPSGVNSKAHAWNSAAGSPSERNAINNLPAHPGTLAYVQGNPLPPPAAEPQPDSDGNVQ